MGRALVLSILVALVVPASAAAKGFDRLVVVGAAGDSVVLRSPLGLADSLFDGANRFNRGYVPVEVGPRGSYVRFYPLDDRGHVGIPGRFYQQTGAVCMSWVQAGRPGRPCQRPNRTLLRALLRRSGRLAHFQGPGPALRRLQGTSVRATVLGNLRVAVELAFDRRRRAAPAPRPRQCIGFRAVWRDDGGRRPSAFCLSRRGVYARGLLYPLGPAPYDLAGANPR